MATYTVECFAISHPNGERSRHPTLTQARFAYERSINQNKWLWCNLTLKDARGRLRYLDHWERPITDQDRADYAARSDAREG